MRTENMKMPLSVGFSLVRVSVLVILKDKIDSPEGWRQYSKRLGCVEPVFGNITVNKQMNRFTLRGKEKVSAQWAMFSMLHNIEKLRKHI